MLDSLGLLHSMGDSVKDEVNSLCTYQCVSQLSARDPAGRSSADLADGPPESRLLFVSAMWPSEHSR